MGIPKVSKLHCALVSGQTERFEPGEGLGDSKAAPAGLDTGDCGLVDAELSGECTLRCVALASKVGEHRREGAVEVAHCCG